MTTNETLGPAEKIINTLLSHADHLFHGRPGFVKPDGRSVTGVRWAPVTHKVEDGKKVVYSLSKVGRKTNRTRIGVMDESGKITENGRVVGEYRAPGIFPEVAVWMYKQAASVWEMDNEFAAKWASYAYNQDHRDMKVVLAALMLVQNRCGTPMREDGKVAFYDDDFRDVGEAMLLLLSRKDGKDLSPKMLLRIHQLLTLPEIAKINRDMGFGRSSRKPFLGRFNKGIEKWLRYREDNVTLLEGLVKAGFRKTVMELARRIGYKPTTEKFFEILRWKQAQAKDGRRELAIGKDVAAAESWDELTEAEICEKIVSDKPSYKLIVGMVPASIGITRAIMAAAIESKCLSNKDLIILTPTLEELGLLKDPEVHAWWDAAVKKATDMRAANIARNVKHQETKEKLAEASDNALKEALKEETKNMRIYVMVDVSGSMSSAIEEAKHYVSEFLQGFPADKLHVATFNTIGRVINIKHHTALGVSTAFRGLRAGGGTDCGAGIRALQQFQPGDDEDVLFIFITDQGAADFTKAVRDSNLNPMGFGLIQVGNSMRYAVENTARALQVPCFNIDKSTFEDPYAIPRTVRNLVAATPINRQVGRTVVRESLVDKIMKSPILQKPVWAQAS
jgi:hypothetical protein